jgi:CheY-like chemotaxis protein
MSKRKVLAGVTDLFFVAKIRAVAQQAGVDLSFAGSTEELLAEAKSGPELVVLDLNDRTIDSLEVIQRLRGEPETASVPLVSFFSHVQVDLGKQARSAGCERVLPRSQFSVELVELLRGR